MTQVSSKPFERHIRSITSEQNRFAKVSHPFSRAAKLVGPFPESLLGADMLALDGTRWPEVSWMVSEAGGGAISWLGSEKSVR